MKNLILMFNTTFQELIIDDIISVQPMTSDVGRDLFTVITKSSRLDIPWSTYWSSEIVPTKIVDQLYGWDSHYVFLDDIIDKYTKERNHRIGSLEVSEWDGIKKERILTENDVPNYLESSQMRKFVDTLKNGDRIVHYISDQSSWWQLAGREGLAIIRDGDIVANYYLRMS